MYKSRQSLLTGRLFRSDAHKSNMSPRRLPAFRPTNADPTHCGQIFGKLISHCREMDGRPLAELTPSADLKPAEWEAIEAGQAPDAVEQVLMLAAALRLGRFLAASHVSTLRTRPGEAINIGWQGLSWRPWPALLITGYAHLRIERR